MRHDLHEMLMIALLTVMSGGKTCADTVEYAEIKKKFLLGFMDLKHGTPSCDAFSDLFNSLNPVELGVVLSPGICDIIENKGSIYKSYAWSFGSGRKNVRQKAFSSLTY